MASGPIAPDRLTEYRQADLRRTLHEMKTSRQEFVAPMMVS
jgi:hypothetical protein